MEYSTDISSYFDSFSSIAVESLYVLDVSRWEICYIKSDDFANGDYKNKVITVHSKQSGAESDANMQLLLSVERADNPVEIVIHVNMRLVKE